MTDLKVAVVGVPGKWSTETLADCLEEKTGYRLVIDMAEVELDLQRGELRYGDFDLCSLDGIAVKKISAEYSPAALDRLELLRYAEQKGVRVFSPVGSMLGMLNRASCTVSMAAAGIPMPETVLTENVQVAMQAVHTFKAAVFKPLFSTKARGMCVLEKDQQDLATAIAVFKQDNPMMYIQKKVELPGRDLGLVFLGGKYLGAYARVAQTDSWNTTINSGGRYENAELPQAYIELGYKAQALFNMDFTTVDLAETDQGPIIFEVSAFGGFKGALEGTGLNAASRYSDYIVDQLRQGPN
ncbi:SSU ribosomal protein S6P modification protein [Alteromonadaceae bacterium Bs31]|nr:SSU ribosomal protein S6P modification protein [Alteromonadaceae bacterium Bs31]